MKKQLYFAGIFSAIVAAVLLSLAAVSTQFQLADQQDSNQFVAQYIDSDSRYEIGIEKVPVGVQGYPQVGDNIELELRVRNNGSALADRAEFVVTYDPTVIEITGMVENDTNILAANRLIDNQQGVITIDFVSTGDSAFIPNVTLATIQAKLLKLTSFVDFHIESSTIISNGLVNLVQVPDTGVNLSVNLVEHAPITGDITCICYETGSIATQDYSGAEGFDGTTCDSDDPDCGAEYTCSTGKSVSACRVALSNGCPYLVFAQPADGSGSCELQPTCTMPSGYVSCNPDPAAGLGTTNCDDIYTRPLGAPTSECTPLGINNAGDACNAMPASHVLCTSNEVSNPSTQTNVDTENIVCPPVPVWTRQVGSDACEVSNYTNEYGCSDVAPGYELCNPLDTQVPDPVCGNGTVEAGEGCGEPGLSCSANQSCYNCGCVEQDVNISDPSICPQWSPPAPSFCTDGVIVPGGVDDRGCQLPPDCVVSECGDGTCDANEAGTCEQDCQVFETQDLCTYQYSEWGGCDAGFQNRTLLSKTPANCDVANSPDPVLTRSCTPPVDDVTDDGNITCSPDSKVCADGTTVSRDPLNSCNFYDCPTIQRNVCGNGICEVGEPGSDGCAVDCDISNQPQQPVSSPVSAPDQPTTTQDSCCGQSDYGVCTTEQDWVDGYYACQDGDCDSCAGNVPTPPPTGPGGEVVPPPPPPGGDPVGCDYVYSEWGQCIGGTSTRSVIGASTVGCHPTYQPVTRRSCSIEVDCAEDVKQCDSGVMVTRDPSRSCSFAPCPEDVSCQEAPACGDGTINGCSLDPNVNWCADECTPLPDCATASGDDQCALPNLDVDWCDPVPVDAPTDEPDPQIAYLACNSYYSADGDIDIEDFAEFAANYKQQDINCELDIVGDDCYLDIDDFREFGRVYKTDKCL